MKAVILSIILVPKNFVLMQILHTDHGIEWKHFSLERLQRRAVFRKIACDKKKISWKNNNYTNLELILQSKQTIFTLGLNVDLIEKNYFKRKTIMVKKNFSCPNALNVMGKRLKMVPGATLFYDIFQITGNIVIKFGRLV